MPRWVLGRRLGQVSAGEEFDADAAVAGGSAAFDAARSAAVVARLGRRETAVCLAGGLAQGRATAGGSALARRETARCSASRRRLAQTLGSGTAAVGRAAALATAQPASSMGAFVA